MNDPYRDTRPDYLRLRDVEDQIKELRKEREALLKELVPMGNHIFENDGVMVEAKVISGTTPVVELMPLKKHHRDIYDMVTKAVLDKEAVRDLLKNKKWPTEAMDLVKWEQTSAWIKFSAVAVVEEDEDEE